MGQLLKTLLAAALLVSACDSTGTPPEPAATEPAAPAVLRGAGASFPAPLYERWLSELRERDPGFQLSYVPTGSGAGIARYVAGETDFAATDGPVTVGDRVSIGGQVMTLPLAAGAVVIAYNLPEVESLRLSREVYPLIFLGVIDRWDDPRIAADNPDLTLPDLPITVVHRGDDSGTTYVFTQHLSAVSRRFRDGPGVGQAVAWPVGEARAGNGGVARYVGETPGAVGYVSYAAAERNTLSKAVLENRAGAFVAPTLGAGREALSKVQLPADMAAWLPDPVGERSYPIVTYTWIVVRREDDDPGRVAALQRLFDYALGKGQQSAAELGYIPLPPNVVATVRKAALGIGQP